MLIQNLIMKRNFSQASLGPVQKDYYKILDIPTHATNEQIK
jgi:hypothetical protein